MQYSTCGVFLYLISHRRIWILGVGDGVFLFFVFWAVLDFSLDGFFAMFAAGPCVQLCVRQVSWEGYWRVGCVF